MTFIGSMTGLMAAPAALIVGARDMNAGDTNGQGLRAFSGGGYADSPLLTLGRCERLTLSAFSKRRASYE
jgi:hypothetical protein